MQQVPAAEAQPARTDPDMERRALRLRELKAIGLQAMQFGCEDLPMWSYFAEIKTLSVPGMYPERLEAKIAICRGGRIRPTAMMRAFDELFTIRRDAGEMDKFRAFEAMFKSCLGDASLTPHGFDRPSLADLDHAPVWDGIGDHIALLKTWGYEVFLNSGTLLGVVRDKKLIGHDDDVDLAILLKADDYDGIAAEWRDLHARLDQAGALDPEPSDDAKIIKLKPAGSVTIDLFPGWMSEDRVYVYPHTFGELTRDDVLPLQPCAVTGQPIPASPEKMLALNYSEDWQTPNPYWTFPWRAAKRKFRALRAAMADTVVA